MSEPGFTPRYSFIVAAYNVAKEIDACINSLTQPGMTDCEIIVVNDGSTDDTRQKIAVFENDDRVHVIDKPNGGRSDARNAGIDSARGEYLMFVDGDDWIEPSLKRCFDTTLEEHPNADMLVFGINEVTENHIKTTLWQADFWSMTNSPCNKLFHRRLFDGVRFDGGFYYEDLALVPALFLRAQQPVTIDAALYNYRRDRANSIMNSVDTDVLYHLARSTQRCVERIQADCASQPDYVDPKKRLGPDWLARFETIQIFIPGMLHAPRRIADRDVRRDYLRGMLARLPAKGRIQIAQVKQQYGLKMAAGALLYRFGQVEAGHFLLHDTGEIKQRLRRVASRVPGL